MEQKVEELEKKDTIIDSRLVGKILTFKEYTGWELSMSQELDIDKPVDIESIDIYDGSHENWFGIGCQYRANGFTICPKGEECCGLKECYRREFEEDIDKEINYLDGEGMIAPNPLPLEEFKEIIRLNKRRGEKK